MRWNPFVARQPRHPVERRPIVIKRRLRNRRLLALQVERLEVKIAPAIIIWDGGVSGTGTDWNTDANWVGDVKPGANDDAQIGAAFAGVTITAAADVTIHSVSSEAPLSISG